MQTKLATAISTNNFINFPAAEHITLEVNVNNILDNYKTLQKLTAPSICGAVLKSNAYGVGMDLIAGNLQKNGCKDFFVINLNEALALKKLFHPFAKAKIYLFHGVFPQWVKEVMEHDFIPIISTIEQLKLWQKAAITYEKKLPMVLSIDTGLNRTGIPYTIGQNLLSNWFVDYPELDMLFWQSHLTYSDSNDREIHQQQLKKVNYLKKIAPNFDVSLANSGGIFLGKDFHFNLCRPGIGLYGLDDSDNTAKILKPSIKLWSKVLQIQNIKKGDSVGYDATFTTSRDTKIATLGIGYADGIPWRLQNKGYVDFSGFLAPIVGRISMNLITVDVTSVPENLLITNSWACVCGSEGNNFSDWAKLCDTSIYEIITKLGNNLPRVC
jgi:alanine racemase